MHGVTMEIKKNVILIVYSNSFLSTTDTVKPNIIMGGEQAAIWNKVLGHVCPSIHLKRRREYTENETST
jgi:hypothetical protein